MSKTTPLARTRRRTDRLVAGIAVTMAVSGTLTGPAQATSLLVAASPPRLGSSGPGDRPDDDPIEPYVVIKRSDWAFVPGPWAKDEGVNTPIADAIAPVAERIYELGAEKGFAFLRTDYEKRSIELLWRGELPPEIKEYVAAKPYGVDVMVTETAKYSRYELDQARARLFNSSEGPAIASTDLNNDGSGFKVAVFDKEVDEARIAKMRAIAGVEDIQVRGGALPAGTYSRDDDSPAWKGGARTRHTSYAPDRLCSSGFPVIYNGTGRLLSARHCDSGANSAVSDGKLQQIAPGSSSVSAKAAVDSLLIDPTASPATTPLIYRGGWDGAYTATVRSSASNWPNDPVCTSGGTTGEHCGHVYDDADTVQMDGVQVPVIQVTRSTVPMGGQADSGGAMWRAITTGAEARGILLGNVPEDDDGGFFPEVIGKDNCDVVTPDTPDTAGDPFKCSRWINYVPISAIINAWAAGGNSVDVEKG